MERLKKVIKKLDSLSDEKINLITAIIELIIAIISLTKLLLELGLL